MFNFNHLHFFAVLLYYVHVLSTVIIRNLYTCVDVDSACGSCWRPNSPSWPMWPSPSCYTASLCPPALTSSGSWLKRTSPTRSGRSDLLLVMLCVIAFKLCKCISFHIKLYVFCIECSRWKAASAYCRCLILRKFLIQQFNSLASNHKNIKSQMPNFYHDSK